MNPGARELSTHGRSNKTGYNMGTTIRGSLGCHSALFYQNLQKTMKNNEELSSEMIENWTPHLSVSRLSKAPDCLLFSIFLIN